MFKQNVCESVIGKLLLLASEENIELSGTKIDFMLYYIERNSMLLSGSPMLCDPEICLCSRKPYMFNVYKIIRDLKYSLKYNTGLYNPKCLSEFDDDLIEKTFSELKGKTKEELTDDYHKLPEYVEDKRLNYSDLLEKNGVSQNEIGEIIAENRCSEWVNQFAVNPGAKDTEKGE